MITLSEVENAILRLSQVECDRLAEWRETIRRTRLRVSEPAAKHRAGPQVPMTFEEYLELEANSPRWRSMRPPMPSTTMGRTCWLLTQSAHFSM
jgi:hypothetical protein